MDKAIDRLAKLEDDFQHRHTLSENFEAAVMERIQASVAKVAEDMGLSQESLDSRIGRKLQVFMRDLEKKCDRIEDTLRLRSGELDAGIKRGELALEEAVGTITGRLDGHDKKLLDQRKHIESQVR